MVYSHRRQKVVDLLLQKNLDAMVFCQAENIRYLSGFTGSDGALIVSADQLVFLTDSRYTTQSKEEVCADHVGCYAVKTDGITDFLVSISARSIGFEPQLSYGFVSELKNKGADDWQWCSLKEELQHLRLHKSVEEIDCLTRAAEMNAAVFADVSEMLRPGVRESDIALALEIAMRKLGAEDRAFDIIVASGVRGALPHAVASDKLLCEGELVTIDFGCCVAGYHSDETVTVALGSVSDELRSVFDTVLEAHDRALDAVSPGVALLELDRIARDYISECGYADYFGHGLGHGIGLEVHEAPTLSPRSTSRAEAGMVFTVEPGIYIPGLGGVRIEDTVLVSDEGYQKLTKIPKTYNNILLN